MTLDDVLNNISLRFGFDQLDVIIPQGVSIDLHMLDLSGIDISDIDSELCNISKLILLFNGLYSYANKKYAEYASSYERTYASTCIEYEKRLKDNDSELVEKLGGRVTDKKLANAVVVDDAVKAMQDLKTKYDNMRFSFQKILHGLEKKHDAIIQLSTKRNRLIQSRTGEG